MLPNSVSYCRAELFKVSAAAPRPRKRGRLRVAISDRPPSPPWDPLKVAGKRKEKRLGMAPRSAYTAATLHGKSKSLTRHTCAGRALAALVPPLPSKVFGRWRLVQTRFNAWVCGGKH